MPLPVPLDPEVIEIQLALSLAVHEQLPSVVTLMLPVPPVLSKVPDDGLIEYVHGAPAYETLTVLPATVNDPLRGDVDEFDAIE